MSPDMLAGTLLGIVATTVLAALASLLTTVRIRAAVRRLRRQHADDTAAIWKVINELHLARVPAPPATARPETRGCTPAAGGAT